MLIPSNLILSVKKYSDQICTTELVPLKWNKVKDKQRKTTNQRNKTPKTNFEGHSGIVLDVFLRFYSEFFSKL